MRAVSRDRDTEILCDAERHSETTSVPPGPPGESVSIVGKTVSWVRKYLGEVFEIPPEAIALVDGKRVSEEVILKQAQILEFSDEEGDEGQADDLYRSPEFWEMIRQRRREEAIPWDEAMRRLELD
jgi:hypothetical protein